MALFIIFYVYAGIGQFFFSGKITTQSAQVLDSGIPAFYYLMNFNDFGMSMVTLFHIMVVNNWWVTTNMLCVISDSNWPRYFITTFWILIVLVVANLILSNVIEIQDNRSAEVRKVFEKRR